MKKQAKRFTSLLCVLALCMTLLPVSALAAEGEPVDGTPQEPVECTMPEPSDEPSAEPSAEPSEEFEPTESLAPAEEPEPTDSPDQEDDLATQAEGDVAQIGEDTYATLDEAVTAAVDGDTIELLADATTKGLNLSKNLTITAAESLDEKPTITFTQYGIALWGKTLTFRDVNVIMEGIGSTPYTAEWGWMTICASKDASLTLDNVTMTMDAADTTNSPHAIYFCNNNVLNIVNGSVLTIENYANDALEWDGGNGGYNVNIADSTFVSDHNRSGFTGTFYATITNSEVDVINSTGNGSNGSHFIIKDSDVDFSNNGSHGLSAGELSIDNSIVTAQNNKGMGITVNNAFTVKNNSVVTVTGNAENSSYGYAAVRLYNDFDFTVDSTSKLYIKDNNNTGLYVRQGNLTVEDGATLEITGNKVTHNLLDGYGGGVYVGYGDNYDPTVILPADAVIYNNHAITGGDDIYVSEGVNGPSLTFGEVGSDWTLDGDPDCADAIDSWYDDSEGTRWEAHTAPYHAELYQLRVNEDYPTATVYGPLALKAAHGLIPVDPGDPATPEWTHSKSKTATNLDENYESDVTLSLPSSEEQLVSDVVFVLDKSTSAELENQILSMLNDLKDQVAETGAKIKVGVVIFNRQANDVLPLTELTEGNMSAIEDAIKTDISSGNMGILDGYLDGTFRPTAPITRSEFTKVAVSFFDYAEENFRYDGRFSDVEGDEWYVNFLAAAIEYGLIEGMPDGTFHPLDNITRAEACTIVNRTLGREPHEDHLLSRREMITWPDNSTTAWYYADMQEATNSHDYAWIVINEDEDDEMEVEEWTEKLEERDWAALERAWSDAHDAPGGEVMD